MSFHPGSQPPVPQLCRSGIRSGIRDESALERTIAFYIQHEVLLASLYMVHYNNGGEGSSSVPKEPLARNRASPLV
jgi:hypothetical protein